MSIETLIVTVDRDSDAVVREMNVQTDAIVGNQCAENSVWSFYENGRKTVFYNTADRGIGKNRNIVLKNSQADICVFADDDMTFLDGYPEIVQKAFAECYDGDVLIFNLIEKYPRRYVNREKKRIHKYNYAKCAHGDTPPKHNRFRNKLQRGVRRRKRIRRGRRYNISQGLS